MYALTANCSYYYVRYLLSGLLLVSATLLVCCSPSRVTSGSPPSVIGQSNFIFYGEVIQPGSSNLSVPVSGNSAVVRVLDVVDAHPMFENMNGKNITVILNKNGQSKAGDKKVYYTVGWHYGKTLGVKEIPNTLKAEPAPGLKESIAQERTRIRNDSLGHELRKSAVVIQGIVNNIQSIDETRYIESEHKPEYRLATIEIKEVIKGTLNERTTTVYFASSDDVMWYHSPKLTRGQEAIFLLQLNQAPPSYSVQGYTVLDRRDVQPVTDLPKIRELLKN